MIRIMNLYFCLGVLFNFQWLSHHENFISKLFFSMQTFMAFGFTPILVHALLMYLVTNMLHLLL